MDENRKKAIERMRNEVEDKRNNENAVAAAENDRQDQLRGTWVGHHKHLHGLLEALKSALLEALYKGPKITSSETSASGLSLELHATHPLDDQHRYVKLKGYNMENEPGSAHPTLSIEVNGLSKGKQFAPNLTEENFKKLVWDDFLPRQ